MLSTTVSVTRLGSKRTVGIDGAGERPNRRSNIGSARLPSKYQMRSVLTFSLPLSGIDSEEFVGWCDSNLIEREGEYQRHVRRVSRRIVSDDTVVMQFATDDRERVLFRLRSGI